jgi:hypothetical protein
MGIAVHIAASGASPPPSRRKLTDVVMASLISTTVEWDDFSIFTTSPRAP